MTKKAFTLIELSIVLIIIGLLVGGVLAGRELINQANIRSINAQWQDYNVATNAYILKYDELAGDHDNAEDFFGAANTNNGDGDGEIEQPRTTGPDTFLYWQHLQLAGLIAGDFTGTPTFGQAAATIGANVPELNGFDGVGVGIFAGNRADTPDRQGVAPHNHNLYLGGTGAFMTFTGILTVEFMQELERKYDDGVASTGRVRSHGAVGVTTFGTQNCVSGTIPNYDYTTNLDSPCTGMLVMNF